MDPVQDRRSLALVRSSRSATRSAIHVPQRRLSPGSTAARAWGTRSGPDDRTVVSRPKPPKPLGLLLVNEINNPLAFVSSNLEYLAQQVAPAGPALGVGHRDLVEAIAESTRGVERIAGIVRDLQTFNRRERSSAPEQVDPNQVLEFALRITDSALRQQVRLVKDLQPVPLVPGGEARLAQVFFNILVNAGQSVEAGPHAARVVKVSTRFDAAAQEVVIEVSDQGAGMAPEVVSRVFEPLFSTKPVGAGTGLGLFVCHAIITDLGGEITVESKLGEGTTFRVILPAVGPAPVAAPALPRVLVMDDEPMIGTSLRRAFAGRYEIVPVADPQEALERIQQGERFLMALVDLVMPKMSGPEFLARLRQFDPALARRSVVFTGASLEDAAAGFPAGERPAILRKSGDLEQLTALLDTVRDAQAT
jgi:CheY-like chemotaxis protein